MIPGSTRKEKNYIEVKAMESLKLEEKKSDSSKK